MNTFTVAIVSVALSVAAQFSLKTGMSSEGVRIALAQPYSLRTLFDVLTERHVFGGFLLYGVGAVVWLGVLAKWDVSKAYPLVGLGFVLTVAIGFFAGEQVTLRRVIGVALIYVGVFLIARS